MPHDRRGREIRVGDIVTLRGVVLRVSPGERACNVAVQALEPDDDANEYKPQITCNARSFEKIEDAPPAQADDGA